MPDWIAPPNTAQPQTPQQLLQPDNVSALPLDDIQGDALVGLQKRAERFFFFTIVDIASFKRHLGTDVYRMLTTAADAVAREHELSTHKAMVAAGQSKPGLVPTPGLNVAFTGLGLSRLGQAFTIPVLGRPPASIASACSDPTPGGQPVQWEAAFLQADIDGVFIVTGNGMAEVDAHLATLVGHLAGSVTEAWQNGAVGQVRTGRGAGREHFGWQDGISQPAVAGLADPFPGQDTIDAGRFVFHGPLAPPPVPWMANGSFMVFRKLEQDVGGFNNFMAQAALDLRMDEALLGARMVGRWKSGAPLDLAPLQDDLALASDPSRNNDFQFDNDAMQRRCPFGSHIRKTNPRNDLPPGSVDVHRVMRAGIPYGTDFPGEGTRGLLFVCYQTSIENGFEFLQGAWCNNTSFPFGKTRQTSPAVLTNQTPPPMTEQVMPGHDPIIGQASGANRFMDEPVPNYPAGSTRSHLSMPGQFVIARATAYLFLPSLSAIADQLSK